MVKTLELNNNTIVMWGDTHGNWDYLEREIRNKQITNVNFIQVGDFGVGLQPYDREERQLTSLNEKLEKANCKVYAIRGNHDNPYYFKGTKNIYNNIVFVEDYTVLEQNGTNILCIGGAISIDRLQRRAENRQLINEDYLVWYHGEKFVYDEEKLNEIIDNNYIDIVVTHTAPMTFYPEQFNHLVMTKAAKDLTLLEDLKQEREQMQKIFEAFLLKPRYWFYGHFHENVTREMGDTIAVLVGVNELKDLRI